MATAKPSRARLERHGVPKTLDDLKNHYAVDHVSSATSQPISLEFRIDRKL